MEKYILALDQGTTSSRAILFNKKGRIVEIAQKELNQFYPKAGWVEQDPIEIWESQYQVILDLLKHSNTSPNDIHAIGITNQRETTIVWNKNTGKPIYNAIVWQDKRTADICQQLKAEGLADYVSEQTGLVVDSYFSGTKVKWILDNVSGAKKEAQAGNLLFGTVDSWLIWKLSKGKLHVTDYTNASRTLLFNINALRWDTALLKKLEVPFTMLPQVVASSEKIGFADPELFNGVEILIAGIAGDQQSALFGQACFEPGMAKNTYGTGCFILQNTGTQKVESKQGLITTLNCQTSAGKPKYALEGSVFVAGAAIKWLRDALHLITDAPETEDIAHEMGQTEGIYVVPAFAGLGAPYWDMYARGAIFGLTLGSTDKHIVKATLESLAYQSKDVLDAMAKDAGLPVKKLFVDGGASNNAYLMQFQSDLLATEVVRPQNTETTALGAAFLAGLASGFWKDYSELMKLNTIDNIFNQQMEDSQVEKLYKGWQKAVKRCMNWEE